MTLFLPSDNIIVERIANGDNRLLGMLYDKWRSDFENVLRPNCSSSLSGEIDFDELYQESVLVLYNYIISGKIFTQGDKIYCVNKYDEINVLSANLKTYMINIGKLKLQAEIRRVSKSLDLFDRIHILTDSHSSSEFDASDYMAAPVDTTRDGSDPEYLDWVSKKNEDDSITLVREILKKMTDPCKTIFHYIYFGEEGKRMSVKDIQKKMPQYTNEASVRNQTSRCNKKFKETFMKLRKLL